MLEATQRENQGKAEVAERENQISHELDPKILCFRLTF